MYVRTYLKFEVVDVAVPRHYQTQQLILVWALLRTSQRLLKSQPYMTPMICFVMFRYVMLCYVMWSYVMTLLIHTHTHTLTFTHTHTYTYIHIHTLSHTHTHTHSHTHTLTHTCTCLRPSWLTTRDIVSMSLPTPNHTQADAPTHTHMQS
jgi:ABC-type nickel/cobalt efflux system permease component RcnA